MIEMTPDKVPRLLATKAKTQAMSDNAVVVHMTPEAARALTDEIKRDAAALWDKIATAYTERAWQVLGYGSWDDYCNAEFASLRLRLPREERQHVMRSLRESGLSIRAMESATSVSHTTIAKDLDQVYQSGTPPDLTLITGRDGKTYPKPQPKPEPEPEPKPELPDIDAEVADEPESVIDPEDLAKFMEIEERIDAADAKERVLAIEQVGLLAKGLAWSLRNLIDILVYQTSADEAVRVAREQAHILDDLDAVMEEFCTWQGDPLANWGEDEGE
jgi:hypothetical protein